MMDTGDKAEEKTQVEAAAPAQSDDEPAAEDEGASSIVDEIGEEHAGEKERAPDEQDQD
jgi:hypothetical protein